MPAALGSLGLKSPSIAHSPAPGSRTAPSLRPSLVSWDCTAHCERGKRDRSAVHSVGECSRLACVSLRVCRQLSTKSARRGQLPPASQASSRHGRWRGEGHGWGCFGLLARCADQPINLLWELCVHDGRSLTVRLLPTTTVRSRAQLQAHKGPVSDSGHTTDSTGSKASRTLFSSLRRNKYPGQAGSVGSCEHLPASQPAAAC